MLFCASVFAQVKTRVQTDIREVDQAKKGLELFKSMKDSTVDLSQAGDTLAVIAEDSISDRLGTYEEDVERLRREIGEYSEQLQETNPDSVIMAAAMDSLDRRIADQKQVQQLRQLFNKYKPLFKREKKKRKDELKVLKRERRRYDQAEKQATRDDSLLAIRIRLNEIDVEIAEIAHDQDSVASLVSVLKKKSVDSAALANLAKEYGPKSYRDAQRELSKMTANADPEKLLFGQEPAAPGLPSANSLPSAEPPQAPPPLPKYNTLAKELMDPKAFTEGKFKDKQLLLDKGHKQLSELKEKYTKVPDSSDLKSALKKNSLSEQPLRKRFFFTGTNNIQIARSHVVVEFNGQVGYQFNRVWRAGFGGSINTEWYGEKPHVRWKEGHPFSWNLFGQYTFFKSYVAHIEFEPVKTPAGGDISSDMRHKLLIGVGKIFAIPKLEKVDGVVLLLYDTTSGENFGNRFKVRFGVNVGL